MYLAKDSSQGITPFNRKWLEKSTQTGYVWSEWSQNHGLTVLWHRYTTCTSNFPPKRLKQPLTSSVGMNLTWTLIRCPGIREPMGGITSKCFGLGFSVRSFLRRWSGIILSDYVTKVDKNGYILSSVKRQLSEVKPRLLLSAYFKQKLRVKRAFWENICTRLWIK